MFGIFRAAKDALRAQVFLHNFISYAVDSLAIFGHEKGCQLIAQSEWAAEAELVELGNDKELQFRLNIPFSNFFAAISPEKRIRDEVPTNESLIRIFATEDFNGFELNAFTSRKAIQVSAVNRPELNLKVTWRARHLVRYASSKGATDMTKVLNGEF